MSKVKAIHDDRSTNAKPRKANELAAMIRSGQADEILSGLELRAKPGAFMLADSDREAIGAELVADLLRDAKNRYGDTE